LVLIRNRTKPKKTERVWFGFQISFWNLMNQWTKPNLLVILYLFIFLISKNGIIRTTRSTQSLQFKDWRLKTSKTIQKIFTPIKKNYTNICPFSTYMPKPSNIQFVPPRPKYWESLRRILSCCDCAKSTMSLSTKLNNVSSYYSL
jgi:hypothetical protein